MSVCDSSRLTPNDFAIQFEALRPQLLALACRKVNTDDAQDMVQSCAVTALQVLHKFHTADGPSGLFRWLERILAYQLLRETKRPTPDLTIERTNPPLEHDTTVLYSAIARLLPKHQAVVLGRLWGYSTVQLARQLGCHRNTVHNRLLEAEKLLGRRLAPSEAYSKGFFNECAAATIYHRPVGVWKPWRHNHPSGFVPKPPCQCPKCKPLQEIQL